MGALNHWVAGTELKQWRNRHVDEIAVRIVNGAAVTLNERFALLTGQSRYE